MNGWLFFLLLTLFCILTEAFFSGFEMACVSFNRVRLEFYASKNKRRAVWLKFLLDKPSRLFGTTLIVVNIVLQLGSEAARRFYEAINLSPDFAPLTQIFIVVIFGELAPLFAARRHPEHLAFLSVPLVYGLSKILMPVIWLINGISHVMNILFNKEEKEVFLSREEIQKAFEDKEEINAILSNIFSLKKTVASKLMLPLEEEYVVKDSFSVEKIMEDLSDHYSPFFPIYHDIKNNVIGIVYARDLLDADRKRKIIDFSKPCWFISFNTPVLEILQQFRHNNQTVAIVLNSSGQAAGVLTLDQITDEIFGEKEEITFFKEEKIVEKTLSGDMSLVDFNKKFHTSLHEKEAETLSDFINIFLGHHPSEGEIVIIEPFEMIIVEPSLFGTKTVLVRTMK